MLDNPNYFTGNPLERRSEHRGDTDWLGEQINHPDAQMLSLWRGQPLLASAEKPLWLSPAARSEFHNDAPIILLGFKGNVPYFAIDASSSASTGETAPFSDLGTYTDLRTGAAELGREDLAIIGQAVWLLDWHRRHTFCAKCGGPSAMAGGGVKRICNSCGAEHFPRTDPVAIVLPVYGDECLLARGHHFPPNMYSALAGFLEPGETLEECAVREVAEEVGLTLHNPRYIFSQPWPFPSSLMTGFIAEAEDKTLTLDETEIEAARWISRSEIKSLLAGERRNDLWVPPPFAIARQLLEVWARE